MFVTVTCSFNEIIAFPAQKMKFSMKIPSVNVTTFTEEIFNGKLRFFVKCFLRLMVKDFKTTPQDL